MNSPPNVDVDPENNAGANLTNTARKNYRDMVYNEVPWPIIIIAVMTLVYLIYTAAINTISSDRKLFGIIFFTLWGILWSVILWVLWREKHHTEAWLLLLIPVTLLTLFFVLVIALDL